ncbi:MAG: ribokinase, partial [Actinocatenispora sp.]
VVVVGSANVDIISRVDHLPTPGETLLARQAAFRPGGKGANQAVAASRLGADTTLYAAVGADAFGRQLRDSLGADGVRVEHVTEIDGESTGVALIVVAADGENTIVVASGANHALRPAALAGLADALTPQDVLVLQLEIPVETCCAAASAARRAGARVVLNAAPPPRPDDPSSTELLSHVDVLIVNETEAASLAGLPARSGSQEWSDIAGKLCRQGPSACVVTLGAHGAAAHDGTVGWTRPAFPADVVDTTGAGDAFCGAVAVALADSATLAEAVRQGCAAGALATGQLGAQSALPTRDALDALIDGEA